MDKIRNYFLYLTVFITGAAILVIEILGTRVIAPFFGSTIFVWSSLISVTLGFLALGYWLGGFISDRNPDFSLFYIIVFFSGILISLIMKINQPVLVFSDQFGLKYGALAAGLILFSLPLLLLGTVTPFAIRLKSKFIDKIGGTSGSIFAFGTVGSLVGALLAGFYLIPNLSLTETFIFIAVFIIVVSLIGFLLNRGINCNTFLVFLLFFLVSLAFLNIKDKKYDNRVNTMQIVHQESSFYADLKVIEVGGYRCLVMDGANQTCVNVGNSHLEYFQPTFGYVQELKDLAKGPLSDKENILVLGLGGGTIMQAFSDEQKVDAVEIDSRIVSLGQEFFGLKLSDNHKVFIDDARSFIRKTEKRYDWIILDIDFGITSPWHIFTREAFQSLSFCLNPGGLISLRFSGYGTEDDLATASIVKTVRLVFPSVLVTSRSPEDLAELIIQLSPEKDYAFPQPKKFSIINLEGKNGDLLVDARNSLDFIMFPIIEEMRNHYKEFGSYRMFFSN